MKPRSQRDLWLAAVVLGWLIASSPCLAQDVPQAFVGARIIPIDGEEIESGVLIVSGGKIQDRVAGLLATLKALDEIVKGRPLDESEPGLVAGRAARE